MVVFQALESLAALLSKAEPILIDASIKAAILLMLAGVVIMAMRRASAAQRHVVWLLAIGSTLILPAFTWLLPAWQILPPWSKTAEFAAGTPETTLPASATQPAAVDSVVDLSPRLPEGQGRANRADVYDVEPLPPSRAADGGRFAATASVWSARGNLAEWLVRVWAIGVLAFLGRYLLGTAFLWHAGRTSRPVDDEDERMRLLKIAQGFGLRRRVLLLESSRRTIPMTWGIWRPKVLVPAEARSWPVERRHAVLAHELAHVKRRDCLAQLVAQAALAVYWFNPLVWLARRRLLAESERACDDLVLAQGSKASDYAEHLLIVASGTKLNTMLSSAAIAMARPSDLAGRLSAILDAQRNRRRVTRLGILLTTVLLVAVIIPLAVAQQRQAGQASNQEPSAKASDEQETEARRNATRAAAEDAIKKGDTMAALRHYSELISLPKPLLCDCRQAIRCMESANDWQALASAYETAADVMQTIIAAPPERFVRPAAPEPPDSHFLGSPVAAVEVQMDVNGLWRKGRGTPESWFHSIIDKQQAMKLERVAVLWKLAELYRERLNEPQKVAATLRKSLANVPFFAIPLETLIANEWPLKGRTAQQDAELGVHQPAATDLVVALVKLNDMDGAIDMQSRVVLANYCWAGGPHRDIEKLWWLLQQTPSHLPTPRVACLSVLTPEQPSIDFDLDKLPAKKTEHKLCQLSLAARSGFVFDSLELAADMESRGGYVAVQCETLRGGTMSSLGAVEWHKDQRQGQEVRTTKVSVPDGTGVIYFGMAWLPDTDPDGVDIHRITVKAAFRPAAMSGVASPFSAEALAAESEQARAKESEAQAGARQALAQAEAGREAGAKDAAATTLRGTVTDEAGKPIAGADVWAAMWCTPPGSEARTQHVQSDGQGRFTVEIPRDWVAQMMPESPTTLWACAAGRQLGVLRGERFLFEKDSSDLVIRLKPAADTSFVVLDPAGRHLAGALIQPYYITHVPTPPDILRQIEARTDSQGRATFPAVGRDTLLEVRVITQDFGIQVQRYSEHPLPAENTIRLRPVGRVVGQVIADKPEWLRGVRICFITEEIVGHTPPHLTEGFADVTSDEQGRFVVPLVAAGEIAFRGVVVDETLPVRPRLPEYSVASPDSAGGHEFVTVDVGETTELRVPMIPLVSVRGTIRANDTGEPIVGAKVSVRYNKGGQAANAASDAQGNFSVQVLPGRVQLVAFGESDKYVQLGDTVCEVPENAVEFDLPPLEFVRTKSVEGRLIDEQDRPIADASVSVLGGNRTYGFGKSDANGQFKLIRVPVTIDVPRAQYHVIVHGDHGAETSSTEGKVISTDPLVVRLPSLSNR